MAGIGFASVLEGLFQSLEIDLPKTGTVVEARTVIVSLVVGTGLTLLSALGPALRATRVPPVQGLREGAVLTTPKEGRVRAAIGVVLAAAGIGVMALGLFGVFGGATALGFGAVAVFLGVALLSPKLVAPLAALVGRPLERVRGVPARIAHENSVRNPGRTASTAAALMIGLALVSFVAIFAAGLKGSIDDAIEEIDQRRPLPRQHRRLLGHPIGLGRPGRRGRRCRGGLPLRYTQYGKPGGEDGGSMTLIDPDGADGVLTLEWKRRWPGAAEPRWAPTTRCSTRSSPTRRGSRSATPSPWSRRRAEEIDYTVTGTFEDKTDFIGDYAASDANAKAYGEELTATNVLIDLDDDANADEVRGEIEDVVRPASRRSRCRTSRS